MDPAERLHRNSFYANGSKFLHNEFGDYLIDEYKICLINEGLHVYSNGIYTPKLIDQTMIAEVPEIKEAQRKEVKAYLRNSPNTPVRKVTRPELIPLRSQVYDIANDCFLDYSPELVFLNRFPWDYDPKAPATEAVDNLLTTITDRGDGKPDVEVYTLLLQAIGSVLFRQNRYRASFMLYGPSGNNGKSTLLNMITQFAGEENVSYLSLQDTCDRFRGAMIYGKAANIGDDIPGKLIDDSSVYKKLVTGEVVIGEQKHMDPIAYRSYAKFFFAANTLPPVSDKSRAFFSRLMVIPLKHDFTKDGDVDLKDREWTEADMTYLMRLAIDYGLKSVIKSGHFIVPDAVKRITNEYETENNPVLGFVEERSDAIDGNFRDTVYHEFTIWCKDNGIQHVMKRDTFVHEMKARAGYTLVQKWHEGKNLKQFVKS